MTVVTYEGAQFPVADGETVLDALLRAGQVVPYGCRAGVCHSCMMSADDAAPVRQAQAGLSDTQKALNYFLSCQCQPASPLEVKVVNAVGEKKLVEVLEKTALSDTVYRLRLAPGLSYRPGQYVNLSRDAKLSRSYSLASLPTDPWLEFHIRHYPDGAFSSWIANELNAGDTLELQGPLGHCIYAAEANQPLLLLGTGTGLAPLWGIAREALAQGHTAPITLVISGRSLDDCYYREELLALAAAHDNVTVTWVLQEGEAAVQVEVADIYQYCKERFPELNGYKIYLCGAKTFVNKLRKQCFFAGAAVRDISTDVFLQAGSL
ncbi:2Fe-2S iron-sulfur cluster binding domain-containing protein [Pseudomaricurvus sp. HS19]|uniref:2Fe-2S iron-sulfur cluster-binding protein n=1 Tax=Pseudomaricurvus sp. HS19 TaxID=2692626 RepID=UPI0013712ECC|nr:2Fe-2S iron-sulfur cluster binding domain-containing protein [Pseudomaricurvus sp. HS19]MYM64565.1 2Fe-2S iron-sulfur cluster binding domain-containing protein [Pseudomaricurvus sp. HS19]